MLQIEAAPGIVISEQILGKPHIKVSAVAGDAFYFILHMRADQFFLDADSRGQRRFGAEVIFIFQRESQIVRPEDLIHHFEKRCDASESEIRDRFVYDLSNLYGLKSPCQRRLGRVMKFVRSGAAEKRSEYGRHLGFVVQPAGRRRFLKSELREHGRKFGIGFDQNIIFIVHSCPPVNGVYIISR